jgi:hypothetical protein
MLDFLNISWWKLPMYKYTMKDIIHLMLVNKGLKSFFFFAKERTQISMDLNSKSKY